MKLKKLNHNLFNYSTVILPLVERDLREIEKSFDQRPIERKLEEKDERINIGE